MIRPMLINDLDIIDAIEHECFSDVYKQEHLLYELEDNPCAKLAVLEIENKIVGYIDYWITFDSCEVVRIAVAKAYQGNGYAHQLLDYMINQAIQEDCETIFLEVRRSNIVAQRLYFSHDFLKLNVRKGYYSDNNEDAIVLGKAIGGLK